MRGARALPCDRTSDLFLLLLFFQMKCGRSQRCRRAAARAPTFPRGDCSRRGSDWRGGMKAAGVAPAEGAKAPRNAETAAMCLLTHIPSPCPCPGAVRGGASGTNLAFRLGLRAGVRVCKGAVNRTHSFPPPPPRHRQTHRPESHTGGEQGAHTQRRLFTRRWK